MENKIINLVKILKEYQQTLDFNSHKRQRIGNYIKALNFVLGRYRKDNEILCIVESTNKED